MTLPSVGNPISLDDLKAELGGAFPLKLTNYYGTMPGIPTGQNNGPISLEDFYGKTFLVAEVITENTLWTPTNANANFIHIFAVGAGGSGGVGWPESGFTDGIAVGAGGGAGGVSYSKMIGSDVKSCNIVIGVGGPGKLVNAEDFILPGSDGTNTTVNGFNINMIARGGQGGAAGRALSGGSDSISIPGAAGGTASGGTEFNSTGGSSGAVSVVASGAVGASSGGGSPSFSAANDSEKNAAAKSTSIWSSGYSAKVSQYSSWRSILTTYPVSRSQPTILGSSVFSFDGSDGNHLTHIPTGTPEFGGGSGGSASLFNPTSGNGGNGVVIIVYEIL